MELKRLDEIGSAKPSYSPRLDKIRHYAFLKRSHGNFSPESKEYKDAIKLDKKLDEELESMNIKVVRYGEHIKWTECFEKIQKLKEGYEVATYENGN